MSSVNKTLRSLQWIGLALVMGSGACGGDAGEDQDRATSGSGAAGGGDGSGGAGGAGGGDGSGGSNGTGGGGGTSQGDCVGQACGFPCYLGNQDGAPGGFCDGEGACIDRTSEQWKACDAQCQGLPVGSPCVLPDDGPGTCDAAGRCNAS